MLSALVLALSLSAPATLATATVGGAEAVAPLNTQHLQVDPNDPSRDPQFVDRYLSFQLSPLASQQTKDGLVVGHILGYLLYPLCGTLWGPVVMTKDGEFSGDVVVTWFLSGVLWGVIATAATFTAIGAVLWLAYPYLQSTAVFNELDRGIKKRGLAKGVTPTAPPTPGSPPAPGDTPPPSYAY